MLWRVVRPARGRDSVESSVLDAHLLEKLRRIGPGRVPFGEKPDSPGPALGTSGPGVVLDRQVREGDRVKHGGPDEPRPGPRKSEGVGAAHAASVKRARCRSSSSR